MMTYNTDSAPDTNFFASLDPAQRAWLSGRLMPLAAGLQALLRGLDAGAAIMPAASAAHVSGPVSASGADRPAPSHVRKRRWPPALVVDGVEYHYRTLPGSGRIALCAADGAPIAMWSAGVDGPWVLPMAGFQAFLDSGQAPVVHQWLLQVDRERRSSLRAQR